MINDFHDVKNERRISLKGMNKNEAIDYLVDDCEIEPDLAVQHVESALQKYYCAGLSEEEARQFLVDYGVTNRSDIHAYMNSDVYRTVSFTYPDYYPVTLIQCSSEMDFGYMRVSFATKTAISLRYLSELLTPHNQPTYPFKPIFHDAYTHCNDQIFVNAQIYQLNLYFKDDEETIIEVLNFLFDKLENVYLQKEFKKILIRDKENLSFKQARLGCIDFARQFCIDRENGYPGGNDYFRNLKFATRSEMVKKETVQPETRALFHAIRERDADKVLHLLRSGVNPESYFYSASLLGYIFPHTEEKFSPSTFLTIFSLLLEYGANIHSGFSYNSALTSLIFYALEADINSQNYFIYENMLFMLMLCDNSKTYSYINDAMLTHPFIKRVAEGQELVTRNQSFMRGFITSSQHDVIQYQLPDKIISTPSVMRYYFNETLITFVTMPLAQALSCLKNDLYFLFKNGPSWKNKLDNIEMEKYFHEIVNDIQGEAYIDLLYLENQIVGYNIAQFVIAKMDNENILIHHIKLALINENAAKFKGIGFFMSHYRSFLPLEKASKSKVITVFEAASPAPVLQLTDFDYYPKQLALKKYMPLLMNSIYENVEDRLTYDYQNKVWRICDPLALYKGSSNSSVWKSRMQLVADRFFKTSTFKSGESLIVMFVADWKNYKKYRTKLRKFFQIHSDTPVVQAVKASL